MSDPTFFIKRSELERVFDNPRTVRSFEQLQEKVATLDDATTAGVAATTALKDASFITLSPNAELNNEFPLSVGTGLRLVISDDGVTIESDAPRAQGGFTATLIVSGPTVVALPLAGVLATRDNIETLTQKTLDAPKVSGLGNYADDAAAAAGGVPVEGMYRNGSTLMVRVA